MTEPMEDRVRSAMYRKEEPAEAPRAAAEDRRPVIGRDWAITKDLTGRLVVAGIRPNMISMASMGFAAMAFVFFALAGFIDNSFGRWFLLVLAAAMIVARLACNILDGMVAIEGRTKEEDGPFWNEFPDRVSDILILGGAGEAIGQPGLGFLAGAMAVTTAYVRELARANGAGNDFSGPMAKQHRMAVLVVAVILSAFWPISGGTGYWVLALGLWIIILGSGFTIYLRADRLIKHLNGFAVPLPVARPVTVSPVRPGRAAAAAEASPASAGPESPEESVLRALKEQD